nr:transcriptional regulator [Nitrospinaceae bacterium]NIR53508.1 transcriptional regulator [Nitrospinaceae bacterium]NIS83907.1 transcriptional regulator [Nitrospinaceae bacterium]NIT80709.1 transcriptional regulator [Nitrospinaceae bacterium]NIU43024.1 transcriptional regulator [Nitrospinaceae bacterium]
TREYYEKLKMLRVHGMEPKYYHKAVGGNFRIDELQAAVILAKLIHLEDWTEKRRNNAQRYLRIFQKEMLAEHFELPMEIFPRHIYNQYVVRVKNGKRDALQNHLRENNVACEIYYPVPLHTQECFQYLGYRKGDLPEAERAAEETLALPIAPEITAAQQDYVAEKIKEFYS